MTKQEFDKLYVGKTKVVHCPTEELAIEFLKEAHRHGYKWRYGRSYLKNSDWGIEKEETCYNLSFGSFADVNYYTKLGYEIVEFKSFKEEKEMNYIEQVAKMLGVEIGKKFKIEHRYYYYEIDEEGVVWCFVGDKKGEVNGVLEHLITGKLKIKKQWKPKLGEKYWSVDLSETNGVEYNTWDDYEFDKNLLKHDAVYKTKEEALQAYQKVIKALKEEN